MRVLRYFFVALVLILVLGGIAFLGARELFLYWGRSSLKDSLRVVASAATSGVYYQDCVSRGSSIDSTEDITIQLRFLSDTEYLIEAICPQFTFDPILIEQKSLPQFVEKAPGASGYLWGESRSGVVLEVFGDIEDLLATYLVRDIHFISRAEAVVLDQGTIAIVKPPADLGYGPITSCGGYGYSCCDSITQKGVGERITGSLDCEQSCYTQCVSRPVVLSFTPNPFFDDAKNRVVTVQNGSTVEFSMVSDEAGGDESISAVIDFGDGKKAQVNDLQRPTQHQYSCGVSMCSYIAQVKLKDKWGVESTPGNVSMIVVQVTGQ